MSTGLRLRELRLTGVGVEDAVIKFRDGLNVIAGPSETGKTYIAQCLEFVLGGSQAPRRVAEAEPYNSVRLSFIASSDGQEHALRRSMDGAGLVEHTVGDAPAQQLKPKAKQGKADTLSALLLALCGLDGLTVRRNAAGDTRSLAFSDIARLFFVDEEEVIGSRSPVLTGQYVNKTVERRVFRALLTGQDDRAVVAVEKPALAKSRKAGRTEALEDLLDAALTQLSRADITGTVEDAESRAADLTRAANAAATHLQRAHGIAAPIELRRRAALTELRHARSLIEHRQELQRRFELLRTQYESDLERLALTTETAHRLEQLVVTNCPVCGAPAQYQDHEHTADTATEDIAAACRAEAAKVTGLQADLAATMESNQATIRALIADEARHEQAVAEADNQLRALVQPRVTEATRRLRESEAQRSRELQAAASLRQVAELHGLIAEAKATAIEQRAEGSTDGVDVAEADSFVTHVEDLLRSWNMPIGDRVVWSDTDEDLVLAGRGRGTFGKGTRAIIRAAFHLGLLRTLLDQERPSPGLVLIDSPLVVYRQPDPDDEDISIDVKRRFYETVARGFSDAQVVVFENEEPPESIARTATVTHFTKSRRGRVGFFPTPAS